MKSLKKTNHASFGSRSITAIIGILAVVAMSANAASWTFDWDASTETPASKGLTFSSTNPNSPTQDGLVIPSTGFYSGAFTGDSDTGWTAAFRVRRVDTDTGFGALFSINDGENIVTFDWFANTNYRMGSSTGLLYSAAPGSNNQVFADVQISLFQGNVNIYLNGNDTPVRSYVASASATASVLRLGNYSTGTPVSEVSYLRWTNEGAFTPSAIPEPSTLMFVGAFAVLVVILRARRMRPSRD